MNILLINPPHKAIGSRLAGEHLPPLGLLSISGSLIDSGYSVNLLDADFDNLSYDRIVDKTLNYNPDLILLGHSGSTSAQPIINELTLLLKQKLPDIKIIIGGIFPTYHWHSILKQNPQIDFIVCGEGEQIIIDLVNAIKEQTDFNSVKGIAFKEKGNIIKTPPAKLIENLDKYRVAWELMGNYHYTYWGHKKAVVIQFSRGCPYPCSYCGQSLFWQKWRHRNPQLLADEIEMLNKVYGVEVFNFADENPSSNKKVWKEFLIALIAKNLDIILVGSIRADNVVRDAEHLHLYKQAGFERFLLGIESYDETVLKKIKKSASMSDDKQAIQLLRQHHILSMATYVVGFGEETTKDFFNSLKQLLEYDPDQIQLLYVTPHQWTPYFKEIEEKKIIQLDQRFWDYKHQILNITALKPWQVLLYVKLIEVIMQTRPKALWRWLFNRDNILRKAMFWYNNIGKRVWFYEIYQFFAEVKLTNQPIKLKEFWNNFSF